MKTKIDIVIVNWNAGPNLRACIRSIAQYEDGLVGKIIVVDNGSTDGSEACVEGLPGVILLRAGTNLGFGKACNLGAQESKSQYLLFLNPDTRLFADSLIVPFAYLQRSEHANIGICGIQMLDGHGHISRTCARFPSVVGFVVHALGLNKLHGLRACSHRMEEWDHSTTREVDQVIGAFFLIRRSLFDLLGGFDERFFVYYEEVDLCYRASEAGWRSVYLAGAQAFHAGGASSGQVKAERLADGTLSYLGRLSDVRPAIAACSVYVLPSYREGTPRTVLEAMAMGRPVITTDAPGCRETVAHGDNGFLVPVRSVEALEHAMNRFIADPTLIPRMGRRAREIAEEKYDVHKVNAVMLREMGIE